VHAFGGLAILYNSVGGSISQDGSILTSSEDEFRRKIDVNLHGAWLCCRQAVPEMIKADGISNRCCDLHFLVFALIHRFAPCEDFHV
jgi:NAD(P)-dependent dehydrogenase (short-subunit alcohol dehydrogenase family)